MRCFHDRGNSWRICFKLHCDHDRRGTPLVRPALVLRGHLRAAARPKRYARLTAGVNKRYNYGYHRAEVLGALASVGLIWVLTIVLLAEAVARLITPPESFDARVMMITALLGIVVNVIMGFSLHQGTHKHFHSHIGGGSCSGHDHGDSKLMEEPDLYELIDLKNLRKPRPTRSRSLDIKCEKNLEKNEYHHHHVRADATDCCDLIDCSLLNSKDLEAPADSELVSKADFAVIAKKEQVSPHSGSHAHNHTSDKSPSPAAGLTHPLIDHDDHHSHDHDHDSHSDLKNPKDAAKPHHHHGPGGCQGHHQHRKSHEHGNTHHHNQGHHTNERRLHNHKKEESSTQEKTNTENHNHQGEVEENHHGHNHSNDHDHGHSHKHEDLDSSEEGVNVNLRAAFIHVLGSHMLTSRRLDPVCGSLSGGNSHLLQTRMDVV